MKGDWKNLPQMRQKIVALYTLVAPMLQIGYLIYFPIGIWIALNFKLPIIVSIISFIPAYIFLLQITVYFVGILEFTRSFGLKYSIWDSLSLLAVFFPYQLMLTVASVRAIRRFLYKQNLWEKTAHNNAHRDIPAGLIPAYYYAKGNS
jgi:hypothetical protein